MSVLEKFPHTLRLAFPYLLVFSVWGGGQYEIAKINGLQRDIAAQVQTAFSLNEKEASRENRELAGCEWGDTPVTAEARDCVVKLVPDLKDWRAARFAALVLGGWLAAHPEDTVTRQAGLKLMNQAWASWYKDYQPAYSRLDETIRDARDESWVLRFRTESSTAEFERSMYRMTANLDLSIASPDASKRVAERIAAHPGSALF